MTNLEQIMEAKGTPTLKAIAMVFDVTPVRLYGVAKQPKEGEVYDAKKYNWEAVERFITRRLSDDTLPTLDAVVDKALEIDAELQASDGRRSRATGATKKKIEVDGKEIEARKFATLEMDSGSLVVLKKDAAVYKMVYQTASHTVLVPVSDSEGTIASQDVKVISNFMLNLKAVSPATLAEAIEQRFSGAYAEATQADAE